MLQPLDLILDHQLAPLQLDNLQVVCGGVHERFVQFILENLVFAFQFNEMRLYRHYEISSVAEPWIRPAQRSVHKPAKLSMGIPHRRAHVFGFICNQS
jgi:hypothetical protein